MNNRMRVRWIAAASAMILAIVPSSSNAQDKAKEDFMLRIEGPVSIPAGSSAGVVWVIGNHADIQGTVHELVVINGTASVDGDVTGNIVLLGARADLGPLARVGGDVLLYRSDLQTARGALISGAVHNEAGVSFGARALWLLWTSVTLAMILTGIAVAYVSGPSLERATETMRHRKKEAALGALILIFGLPAAAVVSFMTGLGFVLGLVILFVIIPIVAFSGYLAVGATIGQRLLQLARPGRPTAIYGSVAVGVLALQVLAVIPVIGGLIVLLSGQIGAGALLYRAWARDRASQQVPALIIQHV